MMVPGPEGDCPKCGRPNAWRDTKPRYREADGTFGYGVGITTPERLEWPCRTCGYVVETPTADQETK